MTQRRAADFLRDLIERTSSPPALLHQWRRMKFLSGLGDSPFFGVFDSFEAARGILPRNPEVDQNGLAENFGNIPTNNVAAHDYPAMWWLQQAFGENATNILDIGGSVGVHYYTYRRYLDMPTALKWRIIESPPIVAFGRQLAAAQSASPLEFSEDLYQCTVEGRADVWVASRAIQYLEGARPSLLLKHCTRRPRHVVLNDLPLYDGQDYVTTENLGGGSFTPVHVYNKGRFIRDIQALGYVLKDEWQVNNRFVDLPDHPERSFSGFTGLYFSM